MLLPIRYLPPSRLLLYCEHAGPALYLRRDGSDPSCLLTLLDGLFDPLPRFCQPGGPTFICLTLLLWPVPAYCYYH